jgi:histidinol-phosphate/aromatic aminotransferase/cobyric acid decarboxylase-like protein/imidazoleglycerol phosphate dehydratase HisB
VSGTTTTPPGDGPGGDETAAAATTASSGGPRAVQLPDGFAPYAWSATVAEVATRHGLAPAQILKFDQNTPALPGVAQIPLAESFATINQYPDGTYRELREAAAGYVSSQSGVSLAPEQIVVGAGADDLILLCARTFLEAGRIASIQPPTYALYRIATLLAGAATTDDVAGADVIWRCNPDNPTGAVTPVTELVELARANPAAVVVVDEAYIEYGGETAVPFHDECPNLVVLRTMSKAFGYAALRVGYAIAAPETAAVLDARRAPAPISAPAARIAAAALRDPRYDLSTELVERERIRTTLTAAGFDAPRTAGNFIWIRTDSDVADRLETMGIIVRRFAEGIRVTIRRPSENDVFLRALGAEPGPARGRETTVIRTSTETALRITLSVDGSGRSHVLTGIGFLDHLLTLLAFHAGFDLDCVAGGDLDVDEHHTVEDVLAALGTALQQALGAREGVARYGSAVVPMDEARATAAVDLVRRAHAEITLEFTGDRVGGLALSLLPHALERFTMEAGCTVHVDSAGADDHHVAEAAFKALGQALRQAVSAGDGGIRSTKGIA